MTDPHATSRSHSTAHPEATRAFAIEAARLLADNKCEEVAVLDVRGLSQATDFVVIATGTSDRQMRSCADELKAVAGAQGMPPARTNTDPRSVWIVADFIDVIVHLFEPNARAHYDLEMLWGDAKRVPWQRPGRDSRNYARLTPDELSESSQLGTKLEPEDPDATA